MLDLVGLVGSSSCLVSLLLGSTSACDAQALLAAAVTQASTTPSGCGTFSHSRRLAHFVRVSAGVHLVVAAADGGTGSLGLAGALAHVQRVLAAFCRSEDLTAAFVLKLPTPK